MARANEKNSSAGSRLARARLERDITQEELAERSGVPLSTLRRLERLEVSGKLTQYLALAAVLECSVEDLSEPEWLERPSRHPGGRLDPDRRPPEL